MANGENPSDKSLKAREAQSKADRTGTGKEHAARLQSDADLSDLRKH
jgi:hypothetical protein